MGSSSGSLSAEMICDPRRFLPLLWIIFLAFMFNLRCSCYSPFYEMVDCYDPAIFYMTGKAWAHGYIPYVDFMDVKGPLLPFINMVGYLMSPESMVGMLVIQSTATAIALYFMYRTAKVFIVSNWAALLATTLTVFAIFREDTFGSGGQCEMLMLPFLCSVLYYLVRLLYDYESDPYGNLSKFAWVAGIGGWLVF